MLREMAREKNPLHVQVAHRLTIAMREHGGVESAAELSRALNVEGPRARHWCNGTSMPPVEVGMQICDLFGVTLDWLYRGRDAGLAEWKRVRLGAVEGGFTPPVMAPVRALSASADEGATERPASRRHRPAARATEKL